jgi:2-iminobutanoate/2-iminopropanoate deaminase
MLYVSGCLGINAETKAMVPGGVGPETRQVLENIKMIVEHAGSSMDKIVKCSVLMADMKYYGEVNPHTSRSTRIYIYYAFTYN